TIAGTGLTVSADGSTVAWLTRGTDGTMTLNTSPALSDQVRAVVTTTKSLAAPALSADGKLVAYQLMIHDDWEIMVTDEAGKHVRVTHEIQHDILPQVLTNNLLLGVIGEASHR